MKQGLNIALGCYIFKFLSLCIYVIDLLWKPGSGLHKMAHLLNLSVSSWCPLACFSILYHVGINSKGLSAFRFTFLFFGTGV
jgi:hypothetical protein